MAGMFFRLVFTLDITSATLTMVIVGTINGWTTISLPYLISGTGGVPMTLTLDESSWIVSLTILGSMIGSLVAAPLADLGGRKYCLLVCSTMYTVGWFIIYEATSVPVLYLARVILGIGVGIARTINPMYVSEVAEMNIRGTLGTLIAVNVYTGSLITCALGIWLQYKPLLVVLIIVSFISILSNMCFPETPYFLVAKGQKKQACKSIAYYKGIVDPERVKIELRALRAQTRYELHPKSRYELQKQSRSDLPPQSSSDLPSQSRSDSPSQSRRDLTPQSSSDLPSQSRSDLPSQSRRDLTPQSSSELPSQSRSDLPSQSRRDLTPQSSSELPSQSRSDLPSQSRRHLTPQSSSELPSQSRSDLPSQSRRHLTPQSSSELPSQSRSDLPSQSRRHLTPQSSSELPSQSRSDLPSQSRREVHSDSFWEVVDTEPMSDLNLPSSSTSPSQSASVIHSEVICEVHQQPTDELRLQSSRELHLPSTSQIHRPSTSEINHPSTNEINPDHISEIQSRSRSDLRIQPNVDSRGSTDIDVIYMDGNKYTCITKLQVILHRSNRKALFIMLGLIMAQQLSGNFITTQYLEVLFSKTTIVIDPQEASVLVQLFSLVSGSLTLLTVEFFGRRTLLIISTGGSCLTLSILATYLSLVEYKIDVSNFSIVPVIDLIIYQVVFEIGLGTLSNVLLCELFPTELKGFIGAIIVIFDGIIGFTVSKLYQVITDNVGLYAIYFIFAISCFLAVIVVVLWIPETKGKTYHEIEALLVGKNLNPLNEEVRIEEMDICRI
ncbi:uncharacterized protein [Bombus flavifrons]|uniref:uncharacterized protein n=1 Tax=Bombus flavifrons TaxID=103934 RepID=UPI003704AB6D